MSIMWSPVFNTAHGVTYYRVAASGGSIAVCPLACSPSEPCQCTGLLVGENISINISATNCEFGQEGSSTTILARPRGDYRLTSKEKSNYYTVTVPSQPLECFGLPVYNSSLNLIAIDFSWTRIDVSPLLGCSANGNNANLCLHVCVSLGSPRIHLWS